jgi:hypothetical protein
MIEVITDTLQDQIAAHDCDAPTRERLAACLPMLEQAIADWQANHAFSAPGLMIAAATPHSGVLVHANAWSDRACDPDMAPFALAEAIECRLGGYRAPGTPRWARAGRKRPTGAGRDAEPLPASASCHCCVWSSFRLTSWQQPSGGAGRGAQRDDSLAA